MPCLAALHVSRRLVAALLVLSIVSFVSCSSTVTSGGQPVTNETLATAAKAIHVAELAAATVTDGLTAGLKAGLVPIAVVQHFQAVVAPKIQAALATAKVTIKTAATAPGSTPMTMVLEAVLALQGEVTALQGWWTDHVAIVAVRPSPTP